MQYSNIFTTDVLDMDENFMSYATTTWMFTIDQVNTMQATLNGYRTSLKNSNSGGTTVNCGNVSIKDEVLKLISIYPNPSSGKIFFNLSEKITTISISDLLGNTVSIINNVNSNSLDLEYLQNGIYFIFINTKNGQYISKVILAK